MLAITSEVDKHRHGVYISVQTQQGITSIAQDKHSHEVQFDQASGRFFVLPNEDHGHELEDLKIRPPKDEKRDDNDRVNEVVALFKEGDQIEGQSIENGRVSYDMYMGKQWDEQLKAELEANRRAAITINEMKPKLNLLRGHHSQNRVLPMFKPVEDSDENAADIANFIWKSILYQNRFEKEDDLAFKDQVIGGRGIKDLYVDFDRNPEGEIKIRWYPWDKVRLGPHRRDDLEDLEYLVKEDKFSKAKLKQLFPDKAKEIDLFFDTASMLESDSSVHDNIPGKAYRLNQNRTRVLIHDLTVVDIQRKEFRVFEAWQKEFVNVPALIFAEEAFVTSLQGVSKRDVALLKKIPGMESINQKRHHMRVTKTAGGILLDTKILDLPQDANDFHLVTAYTDKHGDDFQGRAEDGKGIQLEINKRHSQSIDIVNRMAAYGWFYDKETFPVPSAAAQFKKTSSQAGFVVEVNDSNNPPTKIEGAKFPNEIVGMEELASNKLNLVMGIPPEAAGFGNPDASGRAVLIKSRQSLVGNDYVFESGNEANKKLAKMAMAYVQELYTADRIMRLISAQSKDEIANAQNPNVINVTIEDVQALLDNKELTRLDLVISDSAPTETMKDLTFLSLLEMMQTTGPNEVLLKNAIKNAPFPNKGVMLEEMGIQSQQAAEASQQTHATEVFKSQPNEVKLALASQGILTPEQLEQAQAQSQQEGPVQ